MRPIPATFITCTIVVSTFFAEIPITTSTGFIFSIFSNITDVNNFTLHPFRKLIVLQLLDIIYYTNSIKNFPPKSSDAIQFVPLFSKYTGAINQ